MGQKTTLESDATQQESKGQSQSVAASEPRGGPRVDIDKEGNVWTVRLGGIWSLTEPRPAWAPADSGKPEQVVLKAEELERWDTALILYILKIRAWCRKQGVSLQEEALPDGVRELARTPEELARRREEAITEAKESRPAALGRLGEWVRGLPGRLRESMEFIGECVLGLVRLARNPLHFRWRDCLFEMQQAGAMALPIVGLISFLVGLIMAYQAAIQLQPFGADIFVARLVGLAVVREMGPMMAAIVLSGRTGAAFAAQIGNMKVGEEVDALRTLGVSPIDFLVLPRMIALAVMLPLLTLYANLLGVLGGLAVAVIQLDLPVHSYFREMQEAVGMADINSGLIKSAVFAFLIGYAGCLRGLQCERSASGIGLATTSAVVTAILLIIVSDALFAIIFNVLGI